MNMNFLNMRLTQDSTYPDLGGPWMIVEKYPLNGTQPTVEGLEPMTSEDLFLFYSTIV